jgi:hypothetical protein
MREYNPHLEDRNNRNPAVMKEPDPRLMDSQTPVSSLETGFRLFRQLPAELRIQIWKMALPNRIVEANHPQWLAALMQCDGNWTSRTNKLPPEVARVSWEARQVALESTTIHNRRNREIVVVYRDGDDLPDEMLSDYKNSATEMAICQNWEHGHAMDQLADYGCNDPLVVFTVVPIHAKKADVLASGLFGNLGDTPIQLVDPFNEELIVKFRQLFVGHGVPQSRPAISFFKK